MGYSLSQKGHLTLGQLLLALGHALHATALDWKRLNSLPQFGQRYLRAATLRSGVMFAALSSGVSHIGARGEIGVL